MNRFRRILSLVGIALTVVVLGACAKTVENEHLPEYCRTYSGFMATASPDLYNKIGDINQFNYLSVISEIEIDWTEDDPTREFNLDGIQCFQNLTSLTLRGASFKDISQISALKNIQSITLEDTSVVSISSFKNLSKVNYLSITGSYSLQSVDGVEEMTKLTFLDLSNNGIVDIDELNSLVNLEVLILDNNQISFFPNINQLENLTTLSVVNNGIEELGDDLSGLSNLIVFNAAHNNIKDLSSLDDLTSIEELILNDNDLGFYGTTPDFSALLNAPNLEVLNLENNNLTSISDLADKDLPLDKLYLSGNLLTDITPISGFTELRVLELSNNLISDIDDLSGMVNLTSIDLDNNLITDFSDLLSIEGLQVVNLHDNEITFIPPLADAWPNLITLDLRNNVITDTSGVEGHPSLYELDLRNNGLTLLDGISDVPNLAILTIDQDPDELDEEGEPIVEDNPNAIRVINNSFNNTAIPLVDLQGNYELMLPFALQENAEIYGSFNDIYNLQIVDLVGMEIDVIDAFSFNNEDTYAIYVNDNNLVDISFLLNNPEIREINISENPIDSLSVLSGTNTSDFDNVTAIDASSIPTANSLNGAFVDLPALISLNVQNTEFDSIVDSFNGLNNLSTLTITSTSITEIIGSFNNLQPASAPYSIQLSSGELGYISNSFNNGTLQLIGILNQSPSQVTTIIEDSFNDLVVTANGGMVITDSSFNEIDNSFNRSSFVQLGIESSQVNTVTNSFDQTTINGTLSLNQNNLTTVDLSGLLDVQNLHLSGNTLTDISFLQSMSFIEHLILDVDLADLSVLETATFRSSLQTFVFTNFQVVPDMSIFSEYDGLTTFTLNTPNTTIHQLDGMDSLQNIMFTNPQIITTFSNSFNNMPSLLLNVDDLSYFDALTTITNSFDVYGASFFEALLIPEDIDINDSFNNLIAASISVNSLDTSPDFDGLSFDSLVSLDLDGANYNSYAFLSDYPSLEAVDFNNHLGDITDLNNANLTFVNVDAVTGDTFTIGMADLGTLQITADTFLLTVSSNNQTVDVINSGNVVLNTTSSSGDISLEANTVTVNSSSLTTLDFTNLGISTLNINADTLTLLSTGSSTGQTVNVLNMYVNQTNLDTNVSANQLNIYNDSLTNVTVFNVDSVEVFSISPSITVTPNVQTMVLNNNTLTSLTILSGLINDLQVSSDNLSVIDANLATVNTLSASTNQVSLDIDSPSSNLAQVTGNNIASLDANIGSGDLELDNLVATVTLSGSMNNVDITNGLLQSLDIDGLANIDGTLSLNANGLHTISTNTASVGDIDVSSNVATMTVNGSSIGAAIINNSSIATLNMVAPSTDVSLTSTNTTLALNTDINDISISNPLLQTINVTTSSMGDLDLQTARQVSTINITGNVSRVINRSETTNLDVIGNVGDLNINSNDITNLTASIGTGELTFTSTNTNVISFDIVADRANISTLAATTSFSNASDITTLDMQASTVQNMIFGSADVDVLQFINTTTGTLSINGTNILTMNITGGFSTLDVTSNATSVQVTATGSNPVINTNTSSLIVSSVSEIDINSTNSSLSSLVLDTNQVNIIDSDTSLLIEGVASLVFIDSINLSNLSFDSGFNNTRLVLHNVSVSSLDTTNTRFVEIVSDNITNFTINETIVEQLEIEGASLSILDLTLSDADTYVVTTNNIVDIDGDMLTLLVQGHSLSSLDLYDITTTQIWLQSDSLSIIDTGNTLTNFDLVIDSTLGAMDITTLSNDISIGGNSSLNASIQNSFTGGVNIFVQANSLDLDMLSDTLILEAIDLGQVSGSVESLSITGTQGPSILTADITADFFQVSNTAYETVFLVGSNTLNNVAINAENVSLVASNDNVITSLSVTNNSPTLTIDSKASTIIHSGITELNITVYSGTLLYTDASDVNATSTSLGTLNIFMTGPNSIKTFTMNNVDQATINTGNETTDLDVSVTGLNTSWTLDGNVLDTVNVIDVSMSDFTSIIDTFDTLSTLEINLLNNSNLASLITDLEATGITLTSPITQAEVLAYYYDVEYNALDNATERDNRYASIEQGYIDDAYDTMNANLYFQHWLEADLRNHIGDSNGSAYLTQQAYFDDYITNVLGFIDEADMLADEGYTQTDIDNIKASIQTVLDDPSLVIPGSVTINNEVQTSIENDASLLSNASFTSKGFTLVELP